jgi:hypothetical protein
MQVKLENGNLIITLGAVRGHRSRCGGCRSEGTRPRPPFIGSSGEVPTPAGVFNDFERRPRSSTRVFYRIEQADVPSAKIKVLIAYSE